MVIVCVADLIDVAVATRADRGSFALRWLVAQGFADAELGVRINLCEPRLFVVACVGGARD